ncbi:MAG: hypothetical protein WCH11_02360 [Bdellovibrio sp.]
MSTVLRRAGLLASVRTSGAGDEKLGEESWGGEAFKDANEGESAGDRRGKELNSEQGSAKAKGLSIKTEVKRRKTTGTKDFKISQDRDDG